MNKPLQMKRSKNNTVLTKPAQNFLGCLIGNRSVASVKTSI